MRCVPLTCLVRMSADHQTTANMTNLAIKGIVGVRAMAEISRALHQDSDGQTYDVRRSGSRRNRACTDIRWAEKGPCL